MECIGYGLLPGYDSWPRVPGEHFRAGPYWGELNGSLIFIEAVEAGIL